jgi:hypothetical protein
MADKTKANTKAKPADDAHAVDPAILEAKQELLDKALKEKRLINGTFWLKFPTPQITSMSWIRCIRN